MEATEKRWIRSRNISFVRKPEMSGQNLIEVPQTPEKTEETVQATDTDHTETEEKPGSQA